MLLLEHDDLMAPSRIEMQLTVLQMHPECSVSVCRFQIHGRQPFDYSPYWGATDQFEGILRKQSSHEEIFLVEGRHAFERLLLAIFQGEQRAWLQAVLLDRKACVLRKETRCVLTSTLRFRHVSPAR